MSERRRRCMKSSLICRLKSDNNSDIYVGMIEVNKRMKNEEMRDMGNEGTKDGLDYYRTEW